MTEQPPPIIEYQPPDPFERIRYPFLKFVGGVIAGNVGLLAGFAMMGQIGAGPISFFAVALAEIVAGAFVMNASRQAKPFGIGMLCALPIGFTLFFIGCAIMLSNMNFH
ncbi:MAG: hypothetical protein QM754_10645 [Tepidisphaeraceae bacterium]